MPITLACPCGKPLRVADQFAGRMVKCPVCGATQRAGQPAAEPAPAPKPFNPAAETSDDFEVIEDTIPANKPAPPKPAAKPVPAPAAPAPSRLKAAVIAEEEKPAAPGIIGQSKKPKKKRKKKARLAGDDDDGNYIDRMRENEAWIKRVIRGSAFIVTGVAILIGCGIMYTQFWEEIKEEGGQVVLGVIVFALMGVAAIGKGVIGLVFGQFLGDDE
jgi:hypothetical protein